MIYLSLLSACAGVCSYVLFNPRPPRPHLPQSHLWLPHPPPKDQLKLVHSQSALPPSGWTWVHTNWPNFYGPRFKGWVPLSPHPPLPHPGWTWVHTDLPDLYVTKFRGWEPLPPLPGNIAILNVIICTQFSLNYRGNSSPRQAKELRLLLQQMQDARVSLCLFLKPSPAHPALLKSDEKVAEHVVVMI